MNQAIDNSTEMHSRRPGFSFQLTQGFVTIIVSTIALIGFCLVLAPSSLSYGAIEGSLPFAAAIAIVGLGQLLVVQQGGVDLSVAGSVSLAVDVAVHVPAGDSSVLLLAVLLAFGFAVAAGLVNGIMVGFFRVNAVIATIGVNALLYGAVFAVSGGVPMITTPLLQKITGGVFFGIPHSIYFAFAALLMVSFILKKTVVGRRFEAIGANPLAARAGGLRVRFHEMMAYVYAQLLYCLAGVLPCRRYPRADSVSG